MPIPMPPNASWRIGSAEAGGAPTAEARVPPRRAEPALTAAVAAIVAVAAQRARAAGTLDALRDAVAAALDTDAQVAPPREGAKPERRTAAAARPEETRLRALFGRPAPR